LLITTVIKTPADHLKKPGHPLVELAEGQLNRLDRIYQEYLTQIHVAGGSHANMGRFTPDPIK
jgi:hypothetical protein